MNSGECHGLSLVVRRLGSLRLRNRSGVPMLALRDRFLASRRPFAQNVEDSRSLGPRPHVELESTWIVVPRARFFCSATCSWQDGILDYVGFP